MLKITLVLSFSSSNTAALSKNFINLEKTYKKFYPLMACNLENFVDEKEQGHAVFSL